MRIILRSSISIILLIAFNMGCVKLPRRAKLADDKSLAAGTSNNPLPLISINRASREELERLPGIGPSLASRIVEHRERHGRFHKIEHLLIVRGISERRFQEIRAHVTTE